MVSRSPTVLFLDSENSSVDEDSNISDEDTEIVQIHQGSSKEPEGLRAAAAGPSPARAAIVKSRAVSTNKPPQSGCHHGRRGDNNLKQVSANDRMRQHPKEPFSVRDRKLFCDACREFVSTKGSTISTHLKTKKHELGKQRLKNERAREEGIFTALSRQDALHHPKGENCRSSGVFSG